MFLVLKSFICFNFKWNSSFFFCHKNSGFPLVLHPSSLLQWPLCYNIGSGVEGKLAVLSSMLWLCKTPWAVTLSQEAVERLPDKGLHGLVPGVCKGLADGELAEFIWCKNLLFTAKCWGIQAFTFGCAWLLANRFPHCAPGSRDVPWSTNSGAVTCSKEGEPLSPCSQCQRSPVPSPRRQLRLSTRKPGREN